MARTVTTLVKLLGELCELVEATSNAMESALGTKKTVKFSFGKRFLDLGKAFRALGKFRSAPWAPWTTMAHTVTTLVSVAKRHQMTRNLRRAVRKYTWNSEIWFSKKRVSTLGKCISRPLGNIAKSVVFMDPTLGNPILRKRFRTLGKLFQASDFPKMLSRCSMCWYFLNSKTTLAF